VLAAMMSVLAFEYRARRLRDGRWGEIAQRTRGGLRY
jgi:hypothetical protein